MTTKRKAEEVDDAAPHPLDQVKKLKTGEDGVDRISALPNELLRHILCFVGAKMAIKTSILSRRWTGIGISIPYLSFDRRDLPRGIHTEESLVAFLESLIEHALDSRGGSDVVKFRVDWPFVGGTDKMCRWVERAARHNVKELELLGHVHAPSSDELAELISRCKWLRSLTASNLALPDQTGFHHLVTLNLSMVSSPDSPFGDQLAGSPALENLSLDTCSFKTITISTSKLKSLILHNCGARKVEVCAPGLLSLELKDYDRCEGWYLDDLSSLTDASVLLLGYRNAEELVTILRGVADARKLTFLGLDAKFEYEELDIARLRTFNNLKHLKVVDALNEAKTQVILDIIHQSPTLETLEIQNKEVIPKSFRKQSEKYLHCLRSIELKGFGGSICEFELLKFLSESTVSKANISFGFDS